MAEHPILFRDELVRAILAGTKTETRRLVTQRNSLVDGERPTEKLWESLDHGSWGTGEGAAFWVIPSGGTHDFCITPRVQPGDLLWVREAWAQVLVAPDHYAGCQAVMSHQFTGALVQHPAVRNESRYRYATVLHRATHDPTHNGPGPMGNPRRWRPSIHMSRWACRLTLPAVSVAGQRVQEIKPADVLAEGLPRCHHRAGAPGWSDCNDWDCYIERFRDLWDQINGSRSPWADNDPVWVYRWTETRDGNKEATE